MEINYGFIDSNNVLIGTSVCVEGDTPTIERVKEEYSATAYYPTDDVPVIVDNSIWTGEYFTPGREFLSWVWDYQNRVWVSPVPYPEDGLAYDWDEDSKSWVRSVLPNDPA